MSNLSALAGRERNHGDASFKDYASGIIGDYFTGNNFTIQEFQLFGEVSSETLAQLLSAQGEDLDTLRTIRVPALRINTNTAQPNGQCDRHRGRDQKREGEKAEACPPHNHIGAQALPSAYTWSESSTPASARSTSSTRIPRPNFSSRGRRHSSQTRFSNCSVRSTSSLPVSAIDSLATPITPLQEEVHVIHKRTKSDARESYLDKELPWHGHLLKPTDASDIILHNNSMSGGDLDNKALPKLPHCNHHGADINELAQLRRHLEVALRIVDERIEHRQMACQQLCAAETRVTSSLEHEGCQDR